MHVYLLQTKGTSRSTYEDFYHVVLLHLRWPITTTLSFKQQQQFENFSTPDSLNFSLLLSTVVSTLAAHWSHLGDPQNTDAWVPCFSSLDYSDGHLGLRTTPSYKSSSAELAYSNNFHFLSSLLPSLRAQRMESTCLKPSSSEQQSTACRSH